MNKQFEEPFEDLLKLVQKGYVDSPMGQVHYRTCGEGTPLLMLHMTPQSSLQFQNTFPLLINAGFQVIAPDTPGYGMSDKPESPPSIEEYSSIFTYVLDSLNIQSTGVIGHHTGAAMACELAKSHPDRINKIVLHGVPLYTLKERKERLAALHVDLSPKKDGSHLLNYWNWIQSRVGEKASLDACQMSALHAFQAGEKEWYCHDAAFKYDMENTLKNLVQPCLVVSNEGDPINYITPRVKLLRPDFSFLELEGGSVFIIRDEPSRWVNTFIDFVNPG